MSPNLIMVSVVRRTFLSKHLLRLWITDSGLRFDQYEEILMEELSESLELWQVRHDEIIVYERPAGNPWLDKKSNPSVPGIGLVTCSWRAERPNPKSGL